MPENWLNFNACLFNNSHSTTIISAKKKMVPVSDAFDETSLSKQHQRKKTIIFFFAIAQLSANKWPKLLSHLSHSNFLNATLSFMRFWFKWYKNYHMIIKYVAILMKSKIMRLFEVKKCHGSGKKDSYGFITSWPVSSFIHNKTF